MTLKRRIMLSLGAIGIGAVGAAVAVGLVAGLGGFRTKTVVTERVLGSSQPIGETTPAGTGLSDSQIYALDSRGVVRVTSTAVVAGSSNPFFPTQSTKETVLGSGFVIDKQGHIVTNNHVISGATSIHVSFANNDNVKATVVGRDAATDLAVLKVDLPARALNPLVFGDSGSLEPGDPVVAIGNPFGFDRSITSGIVSALNRPLESGTNSQITNNMIQTDAAINHGNSGGPLLNSLGQVIGVNSSIETGGTTDGNVGVGFAIPSDTVKNIVQQLIKSGKATHPYIGVSVRQITPTLARLFRLPVNHGLMIQSVTPGSGAAKAGLKGGTTSVVVSGNPYSLGGDIITAVDGKSVGSSFTKLEADIASHKPGDAISLTIYRMSTSSTASTQMTVSVTVGNRS